MARAAGRTTKIYVDEFDFSGRIASGEMPIDVEIPDVTCFGDVAGFFVEGTYVGAFTQNGFFDGAAGNIDAEMFADIDSALHLLGFYPGNAAAQTYNGYELQAFPKSQPRKVEVKGAVLLNVEWQGSGPVVRTTVLANGAVTGTGVVASSPQNIGATVAGERCVAILRVLSVTGSGSITVKVQSSTDNAVGDPYADLFAFTAATGVTSQRMTTILATEAWKQVNVTAFSGFTSVTILVVIGKEQGVLPT